MQERLQKIISRAGIASRRHAEDLIRSGQVLVNGVVVTELGAKADPVRDRVEAAGRVAKVSDTHVYLLMHKPPEVVATLADPEGRRTLRNFLMGMSERVFPVGRLDYAASGAVFLTNDGDFANRMLKAASSLPRTYWIKVKGRINDDQLKSLAHIVNCKIFPLRGTHAAGKNPPNPWYEAQMTGVRGDVLRKNLLAIGHPVEKFKRMKLASLDVDTVEEGHYRQLDAEEVAKLGRAIDRALTENKPVARGFKPKRDWRPRREKFRKKTDGEKTAGEKRPAFANARPATGTNRPMTHSNRPMRDSKRPMASNNRPRNNSNRPANKSKRPMSKNKRPVNRHR